jgi:hypothetical protein
MRPWLFPLHPLGFGPGIAGWRIHRRIWRAQARAARRQARAARPFRPFRALFSLLWAAFWVGLVLWLVLGGHEARQVAMNLAYALGDAVRDAWVGLTGASQ